MDADLFTTTCPVRAEFERAVSALRDMGAAYQRIDPTPALARVAVPALVVSREVRASLQSEPTGIVFLAGLSTATRHIHARWSGTAR